MYGSADKSLARRGRKQATATEDLFITVIGGILVPFIYITRPASNEILSPSNKIHREIGRTKDVSASGKYVVTYTSYVPLRKQYELWSFEARCVWLS